MQKVTELVKWTRNSYSLRLAGYNKTDVLLARQRSRNFAICINFRGGKENEKMWSLLKKDLWTSFTDKTIVLMLFTPVLLGIIFKIVTYDEWMILLTMSLFNLVLAPLCNFPLLITEEKEREHFLYCSVLK